MMSKSLAELRAHPPTARPERSLSLCLDQALVAEVQKLTGRLTSLTALEAEAPKRAAQAPSDEVAGLRRRIAELLAEMAEHEGELRIRATLNDGQWRRWVNEHPPRPKDHPGYDRDQRVTAGICNADDLLDDLATYACAWEGEPFAADDFAKLIEPVISSADKAQIAQAIIGLYESRLDFPQWRNSLSLNLERLNDLASHAPSASVTNDSTDGSPAPGSEHLIVKVPPVG